MLFEYFPMSSLTAAIPNLWPVNKIDAIQSEQCFLYVLEFLLSYRNEEKPLQIYSVCNCLHLSGSCSDRNLALVLL